jgi:HAD superfamily hydrolase (TIGR01490 family)
MQKAAFFDVDGTLTYNNVWRHFMAYFHGKKIKRATHFLFSLIHYPLYYLRRLGLVTESSFRSIWADHLAWYLRGYTIDQVDMIWQWVVDDMTENHVWRDDIVSILRNHLDAGNIVVLVSSGPELLIQKIGKILGTPHSVGTSMEVRQGRFTGRSLQPICIGQFKASLANEYLQKHNFEIDFTDSFSYADSITDLGLLEMVGKPVVVYPDEELKSVAIERRWSIFPLDEPQKNAWSPEP